jgi:hypothetical protein
LLYLSPSLIITENTRYVLVVVVRLHLEEFDSYIHICHHDWIYCTVPETNKNNKIKTLATSEKHSY